MYVPDEQATSTSRSTASSSRRTSRRSNRDTVTDLAASSTSSPCRTRLYERTPLILMADTALGTCWISPVSAATADRSASSRTPEASTVDTTSPSASSVTVLCPSRMVARYSFVPPITYVSSLVAFSMPRMSTPVAIGSRVPPCPTRLVFAIRRIRDTTSCDVMPPGLSTTTSPLVATRTH
jgi:hypothetical protein